MEWPLRLDVAGKVASPEVVFFRTQYCLWGCTQFFFFFFFSGAGSYSASGVAPAAWTSRAKWREPWSMWRPNPAFLFMATCQPLSGFCSMRSRALPRVFFFLKIGENSGLW